MANVYLIHFSGFLSSYSRVAIESSIRLDTDGLLLQFLPLFEQQQHALQPQRLYTGYPAQYMTHLSMGNCKHHWSASSSIATDLFVQEEVVESGVVDSFFPRERLLCRRCRFDSRRG
mmetsp:Transcript_36404/g.58433  ORF Transcript_36404/g.58433 Transcript_36404/m.58433 type:complete len:117 (-) Transcript_36404:84-434(-)